MTQRTGTLEKWDTRFLKLCAHISQWSKDPSTKVGAVIARADNTIVSLGYNGFPRGVVDNESRYADRQTKHRFVVHAEANAILNAKSDLAGCTLYVVPLFPCNECAKLICQSGVSSVVSVNDDSRIHWADAMRDAKQMFKEANIHWVIYDRKVLG